MMWHCLAHIKCKRVRISIQSRIGTSRLLSFVSWFRSALFTSGTISSKFIPIPIHNAMQQMDYVFEKPDRESL